MDFYNPSEKIRLMRKKFRVNQADLEGVNMTRAFISMMESGKRTVSKASSKKLAERFKEVANRISVKLDIDDEYFSRLPEEDARYYCENELRKEGSLSNKELEDLIKTEIEFKLDDLLAITYKLKANKYFDAEEFMSCFINLSNSLGKYKELKDNKSQGPVYNSMGSCKMRLSEYDEAIFYFKQALSYSLEEEDMTTYFKSSHSLGLAYGHIEAYDKCIDILEKNIINNSEAAGEFLVLNSKIMIANALYATGKLDKAINKYFKILDEIKDSNEVMRGFLYNNIAEYYFKTCQYNESLKYISLAQELKSKYNKATLPNTLNTKAKVFSKIGYLDESKMLFELAIDLAIEYKQFDMLFESYKDLVGVCDKNSELAKIKDYMERYLRTLEYNSVELGKGYAVYKLAEVSVAQGDFDESLKLLRRLEPLIVKLEA